MCLKTHLSLEFRNYQQEGKKELIQKTQIKRMPSADFAEFCLGIYKDCGRSSLNVTQNRVDYPPPLLLFTETQQKETVPRNAI